MTTTLQKPTELKSEEASIFVDEQHMKKTVGRFFDATIETMVAELLQNAIRAGSACLTIRVVRTEKDVVDVVFDDDGCGCNPKILLGASGSYWDVPTQKNEDSAGFGFFAICAALRSSSGRKAVVTSRDSMGVLRKMTMTPETLEGEPTRVIELDNSMKPSFTRIAIEATQSQLTEIRDAAINMVSLMNPEREFTLRLADSSTPTPDITVRSGDSYRPYLSEGPCLAAGIVCHDAEVDGIRILGVMSRSTRDTYNSTPTPCVDLKRRRTVTSKTSNTYEAFEKAAAGDVPPWVDPRFAIPRGKAIFNGLAVPWSSEDITTSYDVNLTVVDDAYPDAEVIEGSISRTNLQIRFYLFVKNCNHIKFTLPQRDKVQENKEWSETMTAYMRGVAFRAMSNKSLHKRLYARRKILQRHGYPGDIDGYPEDGYVLVKGLRPEGEENLPYWKVLWDPAKLATNLKYPVGNFRIPETSDLPYDHDDSSFPSVLSDRAYCRMEKANNTTTVRIVEAELGRMLRKLVVADEWEGCMSDTKSSEWDYYGFGRHHCITMVCMDAGVLKVSDLSSLENASLFLCGHTVDADENGNLVWEPYVSEPIDIEYGVLMANFEELEDLDLDPADEDDQATKELVDILASRHPDRPLVKLDADDTTSPNYCAVSNLIATHDHVTCIDEQEARLLLSDEERYGSEAEDSIANNLSSFLQQFPLDVPAVREAVRTVIEKAVDSAIAYGVGTELVKLGAVATVEFGQSTTVKLSYKTDKEDHHAQD